MPAAPAVPAADAAWSVLRKALTDGNPDHRRQALAALGSLGADNPEAVHMVENGLQDSDTVVRQTAATVLGEMNAREAIPYLKQALNDTGEVAFSAALSLSKMGDSSGEPMLIAVLSGERKDSPGMVASAMRDARNKFRHPQTLAFMGAREAAGALLGPASTGLVVAETALREKGAPGRALAANALADDPGPYAVTLLEWALADDNWAVRAAAAKALGRRGNSRTTLPKLQFLLDDPHNGVRTMAAASMIRILEAEK